MKKILLMSLMISLFCSSYLMAQNNVSGTVQEASGEAIVGATVLEKGTQNGTVTDIDGKYTLSVSSNNAVLLISSVGFASREVNVGGRTTVDITLQEDITELGEVIVSALGFKENRDNISSTYSRVAGDKVVLRGENKVIDGLGGKMAGVKIGGTSGDPGAGANILIRGQSTIQGETQPLIIVDGVPFNNDFTRGLSSEAGSDAGVNQQSRLNDINPDDIATMQVYKGASAGALYGSRGINGVIVITTKRGRVGKPRISYSAGLIVDEISRKHEMQSNYGQGNGGSWSRDAQRSWGDKISERSGTDVLDEAGERFVSYLDGTVLYPIVEKGDRNVYVDSNFDQVFQTAVSWNHQFSISGGTDETTYYFSLAKNDQEGIIRNSDFDKFNVTAALTQKIDERLSLDFKTNFINSSSNRIQTGSNTGGLYLGLLRTSPDFDNTHYIGDFIDDDGVITPFRHRAYRRSRAQTGNPTYNNPAWTTDQQINSSDVNRFIGSAQLDYKINDNISLVARGGAETYNDARVYFFPQFSAGSITGELEDESITVYDYNADFLANFNYDITSDLTNNTTIAFGLNSRSRKINYASAINFTQNFREPLDPNELTSLENISAEVSRRETRYTRFYGTSAFAFRDQVFATLGGAYEEHSTLADGFFYPSVELGWVASRTWTMPSWLTFGKLRFAYGQVGNAPTPYEEQTVYEVGSFSSFSDGLDLAFFGGGYQLDETLGNRDLKPEVKTEIEYGLDVRLFENRLRLSMTRYTNTIDDVLLDIGLPFSLGYEQIYGNGAKIENKGFELEAGYTILDTDTWRVGIDVNYSKNRNKVVSTQGTVIEISDGSSVQAVAIEGYPMGTFYTQGVLRDENGNWQYNENGYPEIDLSGNQIVGDPNPDWRGGLGLNASWKDFKFNALFETSQGNDIAARTEFILEFFGTHANTENEVTLSRDMVNYAGDVVTAGTTVRGNFGDFGAGQVLLDEAWYTGAQGFGDGKFNEFAVRDGSWTRLREASLSYTFRKGLPSFIGDIDLSVAGRNLIIWSDVKGIDPDINQFGQGYAFGIDYFTNPGTRSYIFTLKATF